MTSASDKFVEKIKTPILYSVIFFFENHPAYEIKNVVTGHMAIQCDACALHAG